MAKPPVKTSHRSIERGIVALMFTNRQLGYRGGYWGLSLSGNCCRIGLIGRNFRSSLDLIRRLRNDFAHTVTTESFSTPSVQSRLRELFTLQRQVVEAMWQFVPEFDNPNIARGVADVKPAKRLDALVSMVTWRGVFDFLVCAAIARLSQELKVIQRVIPPVHPFK